MKLKKLLMRTGLITALWCLLNHNISLGTIVFGILLTYITTILFDEFLLEIPEIKKPVELVKFIFIIIYDIVVANLQVAKLVLGDIKNIHPAFVEVPIELKDEFLLTVFSSIITLTPGTVSAGLSEDKKTLLLHGLNVHSRRALIHEVKNRYEKPLLEIFNTDKSVG